jgi:hypothetical protein
MRLATSAGCVRASSYVSICQHTSAYVRMRACTYSAEEEHAARDKRGLRASELTDHVNRSRRLFCVLHHTGAYVSIRQHTSGYVRIRQDTSAYVRIRQHTWAYVRIREHLERGDGGVE